MALPRLLHRRLLPLCARVPDICDQGSGALTSVAKGLWKPPSVVPQSTCRYLVFMTNMVRWTSLVRSKSLFLGSIMLVPFLLGLTWLRDRPTSAVREPRGRLVGALAAIVRFPGLERSGSGPIQACRPGGIRFGLPYQWWSPLLIGL